jgi:hypothetical protein
VAENIDASLIANSFGLRHRVANARIQIRLLLILHLSEAVR